MSRFPVTVRLHKRRLLSTAATSSFDVDLVAENYAQRTQWAGSNYGNRGPSFKMILPPPNVTGKLHLGHALTVAVEDSLCRHHRIKGGVAKWLPGFDHAGIATQSVVERRLWQEKGLTRAQIPREEFLDYCHAWSKENSQVILKQLNRLGATLDWNSCYYTLDETYSSAVTRAFCELHDQELIYRDRKLVNWCPTLKSSLSDQEVERRDVQPGVKMTIPAPDGGKREVEVGKMYTIRYPLNCAFVEVGTTRPETIFADVALAVHPKDVRYTHLIGSRVRHPLLHARQLPIVADSAVIPDKGTGILKVTPAHDCLDFEIASRHWDSILAADSDATSRSCIDENGRLCGLAPSDYQGVDRFEARSRVVEQLHAIGLLAEEQRHEAGQVSVCSRTGDVIEPRLTEQWFMGTREMYKEAEQAIRAGQIKIMPSFHEGKLFDWLANEAPWCLSRQLVWGHQIPTYQSSATSEWISARTRDEAVEKLGTELIRRDEDVLDTWFSSSLAPLVTAGWMRPDFKAKDVELSLMETGWDILGFWVVRMIIMTRRLVGENPFGEVMLHGLIRDPNGRKMSKSLGNVIDPLDVLDGISLPKMLDRIQESGLSETEREIATVDQKCRYPEGIPKSGADALRFALLRHDVLATDISLNVVDLAAEGQRFCNKLWNLANYMEQVAAKCPKQKEVDSEAMADKWIMSRLAQTLVAVDSHMAARAPHLAFNTLHQFILGQVCDVYLETTKKSLWTDDSRRLYEIRTTLTRVLQPTLVQLSVFMPFVSEHLYERVFRREPGSIYFDFVKPSMMVFHRDEELEAIFDVALAAVSAVRSVRQQLQLPVKMEFEGILVSKRPDMDGIGPVVRGLGGLRLAAVVEEKSQLPEGLILCNLPGSNDLLALKIEDEYRDDFLARLARQLEKAEQRRAQFTEKARKYQEIAERDELDQKRPAIIEKSRRKAQQAASVSQNCLEEIDRLKRLIVEQK